MNVAELCDLREYFTSECKRRGYEITCGRILHELGVLRPQPSAVIDESAIKHLIATVTGDLNATERETRRVCHQLAACLFTKGFLSRVGSGLLCATSDHSKVDVSADNNSSVISAGSYDDLNRQLAEINETVCEQVSASFAQLSPSVNDRYKLHTSSNPDNIPVVSTSKTSDVTVTDSYGLYSEKESTSRNSVKQDSFKTGLPNCSVQGSVDSGTTCIDKVCENSSQNIAGKYSITSPTDSLKVNKVLINKAKGETLKELCSKDDCATVNFKRNEADIVNSTELKTKSDPDKQNVEPLEVEDIEKQTSAGIATKSHDQYEHQMSVDSGDEEESPYDNVITTLAEHMKMFRRKKNSSELDRSTSSLTSKDNFMAVTSKHVSPSHVPRHQETGASLRTSPGKPHFQMLRMTSGFDFVLDDGDSEQQKSPDVIKQSKSADGASVAPGGLFDSTATQVLGLVSSNPGKGLEVNNKNCAAPTPVHKTSTENLQTEHRTSPTPAPRTLSNKQIQNNVKDTEDKDSSSNIVNSDVSSSEDPKSINNSQSGPHNGPLEPVAHTTELSHPSDVCIVDSVPDALRVSQVVSKDAHTLPDVVREISSRIDTCRLTGEELERVPQHKQVREKESGDTSTTNKTDNIEKETIKTASLFTTSIDTSQDKVSIKTTDINIMTNSDNKRNSVATETVNSETSQILQVGCKEGHSSPEEDLTPEQNTIASPADSMDKTNQAPSVTRRPAPTHPRSGVTSVPPPVAKKPARFGSSKRSLPAIPTGVKPFSIAESVNTSQTNATHPYSNTDNNITCNSSGNDLEHNYATVSETADEQLPSRSQTKPIINSTTPIGASKGSVKGIAARFTQKNTPESADKVDKKPNMPSVNVLVQNTGKTQTEETKQNERNNISIGVLKDKTSANLTKTKHESDQSSSSYPSLYPSLHQLVNNGVENAALIAGTCITPEVVENQRRNSTSSTKTTDVCTQDAEKSDGGIKELMERANSSLVSIHTRLHIECDLSSRESHQERGTDGGRHSLSGGSHTTLGTRPDNKEENLSSGLVSEIVNNNSKSDLVGLNDGLTPQYTDVSEVDSSKLANSMSSSSNNIASSEVGNPKQLSPPGGQTIDVQSKDPSQSSLQSPSTMTSQISTDTITNDDDHEVKEKPIIEHTSSFTSDQDVKDAILGLDAILGSQHVDDTLDRRAGGAALARLSSGSTRSSSSPSSPVILRRQDDLVGPTRRRSSTPSYENWTINRAVTRHITSTPDFETLTDEDEDEEDDVVVSFVASPCLVRHDGFGKGSKDSGLCDDVSLSSETGHGVNADLTEGRIKDLKTLRQMTEHEEEYEGEDVDIQSLQSSHLDEDIDAVSVSSDIVFIPGSRGGSRIRSYAEQQQQLFDEDNTPEEEEDGATVQASNHPTAPRRPAPQPPSHPPVKQKQQQGKVRPESDSVGAGSKTEHGRLSREMSDSVSLASSTEEEDGHGGNMDTSYDEADAAREGMLKMRQLLVKGVLDSEKVYLELLKVLTNYKKSLETNSKSTQPVICLEDVHAIFSDIDTIYDIHSEFVTALEPKVKNWHHGESIGEIFKILISKFIEFGNYLTNYQQAVSTIHRCSHGNERFQKLAQEIVVTSTVKEVSSLEDALFKPVQRIQRNTLVLHDLIKYTPNDHPDHEALQKALKLSHHILETFATAVPQTNTTEDNRRLVKSSFLVELVNGVRKLRYMFLFSDVLICTKRETHRNNKVTFDPKWFTPLSQATFDTKFAYTDDMKHTKREDIDQLKNKIRSLKKELRVEMKKYDDKDKHRSIVNLGGAARVVEKLRKKISQYEAQLILESPKLPWKVSLEGGKVYTMLMTTDYEREEWKETIRSLCSRTSQQAPVMSSIFVQDLINSVKETPQVNKIGSVLLQKDEDVLTGTLNVTIHKMNGLTEDCDTYCCMEMDSFGHFFMKARTNICEGSREPAWNEDFELVLESSQTLRFLCFRRGDKDTNSGDTMLGRGALELSKQWLKGSFQEKTVSMNEISLVVSVRHTPAEKTMQRVPSRTSAAVFGVKISSCARRENKTVPTIVTSCLAEVEKRGLDEVGIYRVSGVTSELQRIKKLFDKNIRAGAATLTDCDIHAVTGVLKLYFRELPEPLFSETCYQSFVDTLKLQDEEAKAECMLSLVHGLPDANYYTIVTLLEHLIKVARNVSENKMSIHNLSTIFGPTLLAPAASQTSTDPLEMMCRGAEQVIQQSGVINYLLGLAVSGRSLRRSS